MIAGGIVLPGSGSGLGICFGLDIGGDGGGDGGASDGGVVEREAAFDAFCCCLFSIRAIFAAFFRADFEGLVSVDGVLLQN